MGHQTNELEFPWHPMVPCCSERRNTFYMGISFVHEGESASVACVDRVVYICNGTNKHNPQPETRTMIQLFSITVVETIGALCKLQQYNWMTSTFIGSRRSISTSVSCKLYALLYGAPYIVLPKNLNKFFFLRRIACD